VFFHQSLRGLCEKKRIAVEAFADCANIDRKTILYTGRVDHSLGLQVDGLSHTVVEQTGLL